MDQHNPRRRLTCQQITRSRCRRHAGAGYGRSESSVPSVTGGWCHRTCCPPGLPTVLDYWISNGSRSSQVLATGSLTDEAVNSSHGIGVHAGDHSAVLDAARWGERYPAIIRLWRSSWERQFIPFLGFAPEIRKVISPRTRRVARRRFRQATRRRGHFPNGQPSSRCSTW